MAPPAPPLTAIQRSYLEAFERHLRTEFPADHTRTRAEMAGRLQWVLAERELFPTSERTR